MGKMPAWQKASGRFMYKHRKIIYPALGAVFIGSLAFARYHSVSEWNKFLEIADLNQDGEIDNDERKNVYDFLGRNIPLDDSAISEFIRANEEVRDSR